MKGSSTKPISSPGRTDKFPPPLMRFLKSNVGSRSSRRSRASPMFMRNKKNNNNAVIQEPSSPKVTCIGQVRVKRSSAAASSRTRRLENQEKQKKRPCWKFRRPKSYFSILKRWVFCFCQKSVKKVDSCTKVELGTSSKEIGTTSEACFVVTENNVEGFVPPKNALLLTRCRSAPYRSSSLASRFWGSPLNSSEETGEKIQEFEEISVLENGDNDNLESRKSNESEEMKSLNGGNVSEEGYVHPLLLTRCKSEPARTGARLNPDNSHT